MNPAMFQPNSPGRLEATAFDEIGPAGTVGIVRGMAFVPNPLPPDLDYDRVIGRLFPLLERLRTSLLRLEGMIDSLPGRTLLLSAMRVREAQASSRIENTFAPLRDIALAAIDESSVSGDSVEVLRNRRAIEAGLASNLPICARLIREMHRVLIADGKMRPGQFRDLQVCIGDKSRGFGNARFVPPPPKDVPGCMRDFEIFCNPGTAGAPPRTRLPYFVELALSHYQFETIHPFSDGNGRLGRALVTLAPVKDRELRHPVCNLSEWVQSHRDEYYDRLLRVSTHGDWVPWIEFFCTAIAEQASADLDRAQRVARLYSRYMEKVTQRRGSILLTRLIDHLFDRQVVTIPNAAKVMGVTYPAAQRHIQALEKAGVVSKLRGRDYAKIYIAEGVIRAIRGQGEE